MAFWMAALLYVGTTIYSALRAKSNAPKPDKVQVPSVLEGRPIAKIFGSPLLPSPSVAWYGDVDAFPIMVASGIFPWDNAQIGYYYLAGVHYIFCSGPIDEVIEVRFGDLKATPDSTNVTADRTELHFKQLALFGGQKSEGGIRGSTYIYHGTATQTADDYLESAIGVSLPGYRHLCHQVIRHMYLGTSAYLKPVSLVLRSCPNPLALTGGAEDISGDANPANMIVDILTRPHAENGAGIPIGLIDTTALAAMGQTLATEGLGLTMVFDQETTVEDALAEILRHIDGVAYVEPTTGLFTAKLIRQDYDPNTLPVLDPSNCVLQSFRRPGWDELRNTVRVTYVDKADGHRDATVQEQDLAAIAIRGGEVSAEDIDLRGFSTAANAQQGAARALKTLGYPFASGKIQVGRAGWAFRPGDVFKLDWPPYGISGLILRVLKMGEGLLTDGMIILEVAEDIFGVDWVSYTPPPTSGWADPLETTPSLLDQVAMNAPYELVKDLSPGPDSQARALALGAPGAGVAAGYNLYVRKQDLSWPPAIEVRSLTPSGTLNAGIDEQDTDIVLDDDGPGLDLLESASDADFAAGTNVLWIDDEFIAFKTVTAGVGTLTLGGCIRGCLDTVPQSHSSGARAWAVSYGAQIQNVNTPAPAATLTNVLRFQAFNASQEEAFASSPDESITTGNPDRAGLPLVPTDVQMNGASYPASISGELTVSWEHRNRLGTWTYDEAGVTSAQEDTATYTVKVYGESDTLVHTETGITGTSWTYDQATEIAESGLGRVNNHLRIQVLAVRGSDESWQTFEWEFDRV